MLDRRFVQFVCRFVIDTTSIDSEPKKFPPVIDFGQTAPQWLPKTERVCYAPAVQDR